MDGGTASASKSDSAQKVAAGGGDSDVAVLDALVHALLRRYQRKWDHDRRHGYPGISRDVTGADYARFTEVILRDCNYMLQAAERGCLRRVFRKWRSVCEQVRRCEDAETRGTAVALLQRLLHRHTAAAGRPARRAHRQPRRPLDLDKCIADYIADGEVPNQPAARNHTGRSQSTGSGSDKGGHGLAPGGTSSPEVNRRQPERAPAPVDSASAVSKTQHVQLQPQRAHQDTCVQPPPGFSPHHQHTPSPPAAESLGRWRTALRALSSLPAEQAQLLHHDDLLLSGPASRRRFMLACCGAFGPLEVGLRLSSGGGAGGALAVKRLPALLGAQVSRLMVQLLQLRHTNVLQYALCIPNRCASQPEVLLATPLCECNLGELLVLLKADGSLGQRAHGLVRQLLSGLHYLHTLSTPVVHGNLKPSNVLIDDKGVVRLAEFGLHQMLYQTTPPPASSVIWWSCETCVAYEQNRRMSCSTMSDIQVAGMVVHFILTGGNHPFGTEASQIVQNIRRGFNSPATTNCEANDLISWMVLQNPGQRPSIEKVIR
ncbi:serine/threonine-protein kinase/endoribonuclease IRE2-like [Schistocerca serialis cubense]|uniref:serine/threonine-protein kinase/endoribonuclease IRE2-like n=1 Tax=Schistocerca serialis cubense TaxID=2023355 RepID=UPI00214E0616|nr:serine/threonine-protein kinase/endoribonuclease IRE2-like [Schistocerca serialis cubense]